MALQHESGCSTLETASQGVDPSDGSIVLEGRIRPSDVTIERRFTAAYEVDRPRRIDGGVEVGFALRAGRAASNLSPAFTELLDKGSAIRLSC
jgi:hypothetical protein